MENESARFKREFKARLYRWALRLVTCIDSLGRGNVNEVMGKQLLRSGTSVLANYVEANSASSRKDFINFFTHSLKSANESKVWLSLLKDLNKGNKTEVTWLLEELIEMANIIASSIITLKARVKNGR
jgi:four helix bundle protein